MICWALECGFPKEVERLHIYRFTAFTFWRINVFTIILQTLTAAETENSHSSSIADAADTNANDVKTPTTGAACSTVTVRGEGWVSDEGRQGSVSWRTYAAYVSAAGGVVAVLTVLVASVVAEGAKAFSFWWLAYWIQQGSGATNVVSSVIFSLSFFHRNEYIR